MSFSGFYAGVLSRLKDKLVCHFKFALDMVFGGVRDVDEPAFLKGNWWDSV